MKWEGFRCVNTRAQVSLGVCVLLLLAAVHVNIDVLSSRDLQTGGLRGFHVERSPRGQIITHGP